MTTSSWDPRPDLDAAAALGDTLRDIGYDEEAIENLLGEDGVAADTSDALVFARRLPDDELGDTIRLLLLQRPLATHAAAAELVRLGLATENGGELVPRARIVPTEGVYLAFDGFSQGVDDPPGWVASFTPTAYWLASLTPRPRVATALDVGTGNGAHALFASAHADRVVATDVNPRALAFTAISAALNGIDNVETRLGSLFEPVSGETFDLITFNAPYVISPEHRWQYRDAGLPGDELSERIVRQAVRHLARGGFASLTASWVAASEDDPDEHVHAWLDGNGCDAWVLGVRGADPLEHAADWNEHLLDDERAYEAALDNWAAYFEQLGAGWITEGVVVMHERAGDRFLVRADPVDEDDLEHAGAQIERVFEGLALIAEDGVDSLRRLCLRLADTVRFEQELDRRGAVLSTVAVLDEGTYPEVELEPDVADVLTSLDGATTLDGAVDRVARYADVSRGEAADLRRETVGTARELLELGFIELP